MAHYIMFVFTLAVIHIAQCFVMNGMILNPEILKTNIGIRVRGNDYTDYNPEEGNEDVIILAVPVTDFANVTTIVEIDNAEISVIREEPQSVQVVSSMYLPNTD